MIAITPLAQPLTAGVTVPGSKSLSNRALMIASLAEGTSQITNVLHSDDTRYMMTHLRSLGAALHASDDRVTIEGRAGRFSPLDATFFCGNAGTTVRFLSALCALVPGTQTVTGDERMQARPIQDLVEALTASGVEVSATHGCPPVTVCSGVLRGGHVPVQAHRSSQYLSGLLMIAPYAEQPVTLEVTSDMVSESYVELTLQVMAAFGVTVDRPQPRIFRVPKAHYYGRLFAVEGDATSAGYWWALAALTGSRIAVQNLDRACQQGDIELLPILERMGCEIRYDHGISVQGPPRLRSPGVVDMNRLPDGVMTLAVLAAVAQGETCIVNVANLRIKESNRLAAVVTELRRVGIVAEELPAGIRIQGGEPHGADIDTYTDHRMAMSFAVLGTRVPGIRIRGPECVSKSYPTFFDALRSLSPAHVGR